MEGNHMQSNSSDFQVLAKSEPEVTLKQHIDDCLEISHQLEYCFENLPVNKLDLWNCLKTAICFHDVGKCHKEFQKMLMGKSNHWDHQRHELFSLLFIAQSELPSNVRDDVMFAVAGHHKDIESLSLFVNREYYATNDQYFVSTNSRTYRSESESLLKNKTWKILHQYNLHKTTDDVIEISQQIQKIKNSSSNIQDRNYLMQMLLVGFLKQCDHLASAGINQLNRIEEHNFYFLDRFEHYQHQALASQHIGSSFLSAPTGSGKTETSLLWLRNQYKYIGQGRAFYVLPYTASINAMYERLDNDLGKGLSLVGMQHGKLSQYLDSKFDYQDNSSLISKLMNDFKTLVTPLKIVTPFQLLKHLFGLKGFEKGIAEWAGGYFIFDEIHAYDSTTFAQIVVLLEFCSKYLNTSSFIMTATMPSFMLKILSTAIQADHLIRASESLYKQFDRHIIKLEPGKLSDSLDAIQSDIDNNKKVLVVCNTVEQAQHVYKSLSSENKLLLHGSFNANDRFEKERLLGNKEISLLVGTQAIEVCLDIDYDTIYTDPAPIDALIQRFGRVNRKRKKGLCVCHVFRESNEKDKFIYNQDIVKRSIKVFESLGEHAIIHENEIQKMIDFVYPDWNEQQRLDYENTYNALWIGINNRLRPLHHEDSSEEEFYKQFDGIKVLPIALINQYTELLEQHQYIKAEGLLVSIRESRFAYMFRNGDVFSQRICFSYSNEILEEKSTLIINRKYDKELGLMINEVANEPSNVFL